MSEDKPIKWGDQTAHFGSCLALTLITLGFGAPVVVLWAITREYYQIKINMIQAYKLQTIKKPPSYSAVMEFVDLGKRDLVFSYWGVVAGLAIAIPFDIWLF